ncbi:hypothetical protein SLW70_15265 [Flavobacterium sp. NG2]|uniref:hypothetical protein n=1 Tax=Flavobacterium sp. NG2 TaxID=3097547 RepID=UPI002A81305B|nr:hypothetical protein [Flavobacterium sp. NG2]WPR71279.1 hypothetical protein SLW70_15265 [Flavobacterium sp. NG2]
MNFYHKLTPLNLYLLSILSFVAANLIRNNSIEGYYVFLVFGVICFVLGLTKRVKSK